MTFEAALFHDNGPHQAQVGSVIEPLQGPFLGLALFQTLQGGSFPGIRRIVGTQGHQAGEVAADAEIPVGQGMHLTDHVGRIDQGQPSTRGRLDITFGKVGQVWVGGSCFAGGDIYAAMGGCPAPEGEILAEAVPGGGPGIFEGRLARLIIIPTAQGEDGQGPAGGHQQKWQGRRPRMPGTGWWSLPEGQPCFCRQVASPLISGGNPYAQNAG